MPCFHISPDGVKRPVLCGVVPGPEWVLPPEEALFVNGKLCKKCRARAYRQGGNA